MNTLLFLKFIFVTAVIKQYQHEHEQEHEHEYEYELQQSQRCWRSERFLSSDCWGWWW